MVGDWEIRDNGPGLYAVDPYERVSVWIEGDSLHYESSHGGHECDIPLGVIDALREVERATQPEETKTDG